MKRSKHWLKVFGSEERVKWVRTLPCAFHGRGKCQPENAHAIPRSQGGKASHIVPLCRPLHDFLDNRIPGDPNHGGWMSRLLRFQERYGVNLLAVAQETEDEWQRLLHRDLDLLFPPLDKGLDPGLDG